MCFLDPLRKYACSILLVCFAPSASTAQAEADRSADAFAREYQTHAKAVMDAAVPRLLDALSAEDRAKLGQLSVNIIASRDPLRVQIERDSPDTSRLTVSAGFLILEDLLVDASAVAAVSETEAALVDYSVETARFALQANYPAKYRNPEVGRPTPFWQHIGWTQERYATFRDNPQAKKIISQATIQTHAWIAAYAIAERLKASEGSDALLRFAGDLLVRARFAPVPALGASVLFFATRYPDEQQRGAWICGARGALSAAILIGERDRKGVSGARAETIDARIKEWQRVAELLDRRGDCAG